MPNDVKHEVVGNEQRAGLIVVFAECVKVLPRNEFVEGGSAAPKNFEVDDWAKGKDFREVDDLQVTAVAVDEVLVGSEMVGDEYENVDWNVAEGPRDAQMFDSVGAWP